MKKQYAPQEKDSRLWRCVLLPLCCIPVVILAISLMLFAADVPVQDDYEAILNYLNFPWPERFCHLADFHNEHRIIPTRLVGEIVYRIFGHIDFRAVIWIGNVGWWIFVGAFAFLFARGNGFFRWGAVFACWTLAGFYDHENVFWAMTSVQNHWVVAFAFAACLAFSRRNSWKWFLISMAFAVVATFTSGGGLLVFPALAFMVISDVAFLNRSVRTDCSVQAKTAFDKHVDESSARRITRALIFISMAAVVSGLMLHGLPQNDDPALVFMNDPVRRIKNFVGFGLAFLGNVLPIVEPALIMGSVIAAWLLVTCWFSPRYRGTSLAIFAFTLFCTAQIVAAAVFRAAEPGRALAGRYRLISAAIICSLMYLTLVEMPIAAEIKRQFLRFALAGTALLSTVYLIRGVTYNSAHCAALEEGIVRWPETNDGLDYTTNNAYKVKASAMLKTALSRGVYTPRRVKP